MTSSNSSFSPTSFRLSYAGLPSTTLFAVPKGIDLPHGPEGLFSSSFDFFMDVRVPLAIAGAYAALVHTANHFRKHNKEPLAFCKTRAFKYMVIVHNMALCIYSAWTFSGILAATYRTAFEISKAAIQSTVGPDTIDAYAAGTSGLLDFTKGRGGFWLALCDLNDGLWENGLAYYGYYFYLSKFYEVFDTVIILAKGRQSSLLQTYHHAGAMLSMWTGIRYAAPPIWTFVVFNSLIHSIMYFYYTLSALKIPVPTILKRALTTAQISQFLLGGSFALSTLFRYYLKPSTGTYCSCLANPGQAFALFFNVSYLAPLTYLFVKFWINSYAKGRKSKAGAAAQEKAAIASSSGVESSVTSTAARSRKA